MVTILDDEVVVIEVGTPGIAGSGVSGSDWTIMRTDVSALMARANISTLDSLTDVAAPSPADGQVLKRVGTQWVNATPDANGIQTLEDGTAIGGPTETRVLDFRNGLVASGTGIANRVAVNILYGTAVATVAEGNHVHNGQYRPVVYFPASGLLSSGSRQLRDPLQVGPLVSGVPYDVDARLVLTARGTGTGGTITPRIEVLLPSGVLSGAVAELEHEVVAGVPRGCEVETGSVTMTGTGTVISVRAFARFESGSPTDIRAGYIKVQATPRR